MRLTSSTSYTWWTQPFGHANKQTNSTAKINKYAKSKKKLQQLVRLQTVYLCTLFKDSAESCIRDNTDLLSLPLTLTPPLPTRLGSTGESRSDFCCDLRPSTISRNQNVGQLDPITMPWHEQSPASIKHYRTHLTRYLYLSFSLFLSLISILSVLVVLDLMH